VRVDQTLVLGEISRATVAIESTAAGAAPRIADLRVAVEPAMQLDAVELGPPLQVAGKRLHRFAGSNLPYFRLADGSTQFLVFSLDKALPIEPGRWLTLRFVRPPGTGGPEYRSVKFRLVRREQTLAPLEADAALQAEAWDSPLTVEAEAQP